MPPRVDTVDAAALVARLQEHSHDADVQAQCCELLCSSGQLSDEAALAFMPAIVAALRAHPAHARLQTYGCVALGLICHHSKASEAALTSAAGAADGVRAVVDALRAHFADAALQFSCCGALFAMTHSADGLRDAAVSASAVQTVAAALHAHALHGAGVGLVILQALNRLITRHPRARAQAGAAGAVTAAISVMRAYPDSALLQKEGCAALGALALDGANQANVIHAGAMEAIILALRAHAADADIQVEGCRALAYLAVGHIATISARSSGLLSNAWKTVVAALNAHRDAVLVQQFACAALWQLTATNAHRVEAGKVGAVTAAVAALRAHPADARVQQAGCCATDVLCSNNSVNAVQACGAGALQAIVAGLRAHPAAFGVQLNACGALSSIVGAHPRVQAAAGAAGAVETIVGAMRLPAVNAGLLNNSSKALLHVVEGHRGNAERACAAGVIAALASAMGASCAHEGGTNTLRSMYDTAVSVLGVLLEGNNDAAQRAIHAGVADILAREGSQRCHPSALAKHARLLVLLEAAAQWHDARVCVHDGCTRCAAARERGRMCALAGCGARKRDDGSGKRLHRCGACAVAAYCGLAHQRADYARHKTECAALGAASDDDEGDQQSDE
jgi:hypothetical protein